MEYTHLSNTLQVKTVSEDVRRGVFEIEGLYTGYGLSLGNALRRALLSSLPGAAVTQCKVKNVSHEFATLPGVKEDMVEFALNLKNLRFRMHINEPRVLTLKAKGVREVTGADLEIDEQVEVLTPDVVLATLTSKEAELDAEITVERGLGYSAVESRETQKLPVGVLAVDAFFSPVVKTNYTIDHMRVGERTDFDRLRIEIETDGTISPSAALHKAANTLKDHFEKVSLVAVKEFEVAAVKAEGKKGRRNKKAVNE